MITLLDYKKLRLLNLTTIIFAGATNIKFAFEKKSLS